MRVAFIKATTADVDGNLTMERESLLGDAKLLALAARSSGGTVIAQVSRVAERHSLAPRSVFIPGSLVDAVVVCPDEPMAFTRGWDPAFTGELRTPAPASALASGAPTPSAQPRDLIAKRAVLELAPGDVCNLGIGVPEGVGAVARHEGVSSLITLTTEAGAVGGTPASGHDFGPAVNFQAMLEMNQTFDAYNGGMLTSAFLGMGQVGATGDVNVSKLEGRSLTGPGGFMDIAQCTRRVYFLGTFTKRNLDVCVDPETRALSIRREGEVRTFVNRVSEITFNGEMAMRAGQDVKFITERAVFELNFRGLKLVEIAPGVDLERDVLANMDFLPHMKRDEIRVMDARVFGARLARLGLADDLFNLKRFAESRVSLFRGDDGGAPPSVFLDLSGLRVDEQLESFFNELELALAGAVARALGGGRAARLLVKTDAARLLAPDDVASCDRMLQALGERFAAPVRVHDVSEMLRRGEAQDQKKLLEDAGTVDDIWRDWVGARRHVLSRRRLRSALERDLQWKVSSEELHRLMGPRPVVTRGEFPALLGRLAQ